MHNDFLRHSNGITNTSAAREHLLWADRPWWRRVDWSVGIGLLLCLASGLSVIAVFVFVWALLGPGFGS